MKSPGFLPVCGPMAGVGFLLDVIRHPPGALGKLTFSPARDCKVRVHRYSSAEGWIDGREDCVVMERVRAKQNCLPDELAMPETAAAAAAAGGMGMLMVETGDVDKSASL